MKKGRSNSPLVYSTDPEFKGFEEEHAGEINYPEAKDQQVKLRLEKKHRGGKTVTLIENFKGCPEQEEKLGKDLKNFCGTGGSVKDGEILVQGDQRQKVLQWFVKNGYTKTKII